jgi:Animal haem peroxidase
MKLALLNMFPAQVDASQIYGGNEPTRWALRSKLNGKLKTRIMNGEEFPPFLEDTPGVFMHYPKARP